MGVAGWVMVLLAQTHIVRHHDVQETDASIQIHGREPAETTPVEATQPQSLSEPTQPARHAQSTEHAPWYVYALLVLAIAIPISLFFRSSSHQKQEKIPLPLPDKLRHQPQPSEPVIPKTSSEYLAYMVDNGNEAKVDGKTRTREECHSLYIEGVKSFVQRQVWPEKLNTLLVEGEPIEMRWRAWLGSSWDKEMIMRATGSTEGMALKRLLQTYERNGGSWIAHAVERSSKSRVT